jgi:hypothetical protein
MYAPLILVYRSAVCLFATLQLCASFRDPWHMASIHCHAQHVGCVLSHSEHYSPNSY